MARAKKIKEVAEEIKHEEVEGQTTLPFIDEEPAQTEVEEVLTGKDFPHQQKGKGGRPLSTDKKIQMKLYSTADNKQNLEMMATQFGLTSSQFIEHVIVKLNSLKQKELKEFLNLDVVSMEKQDQLIDRWAQRQSLAKDMFSAEINLTRKIQFSKGQFCPAEMLESYAYFHHEKEEEDFSFYDFKKLLEKHNFRVGEIYKIENFIKRIIKELAFQNQKTEFNVEKDLWKIENFSENLTTMYFNPRAKKMTVSADNNFYKLLLGE